MKRILIAMATILLLAAPASAIVPDDHEDGFIGVMDHDHYAFTDADGNGVTSWRSLDGVARDAYGDLGAAPVGKDKDIEKAARTWLYANGPTYGVFDASPDALELRGVRESLTGYHARFDQVHQGTDVVGAEVSVHILIDTEHVVALHSRAVTETKEVADPVPSTEAVATALDIGRGGVKSVRSVLLADGLTGVPVWEVELSDDLPISNWFVYVDQENGEVLRAYDTVTRFEGSGNVWINPIVESGVPRLRDNQHNFDDALVDDSAVREATDQGLPGTPYVTVKGRDFTPYYRDITMDNLEQNELGMITLSGPWVKIYNDNERTGRGVPGWGPGISGVPHSIDGDFYFDKGEPGFEAVMSYYWTDLLQKDIQALGFVGDKGIANYPIEVAPYDQVGLLNAFCTCSGSDGTSTIHYGYHAPVAANYGLPSGTPPLPPVSIQGFADASEDGEVIAHEYGHAVAHHQMLGYNSGTMHEGWADFFAAVMLEPYSNGNFDTCIAEWLTQFLDSRDDDYRKPTCLRDLDNTLEYYYGMPNTHATGQVHSGALWNIRNQVGGDLGTQLVFEGHYYEAKDGIPHQAAEGLLVADYALHGGDHFSIIMDEYTQHRNVTGLIVTQDLFDAIELHQVEKEAAAEKAAAYSTAGVLSAALVAGTSVVLKRRK